MATAMTYNDCEFLFRLQTQIIDGGTDVLRNIFDQKLQNTPLHVFLANEKKTIKRLRTQTTITKTQYHLLYPPVGQFPDSANFDITLIICLLRNLQSLGLNPIFNWNAQPQPTDTSLEADLCRLKGFRNEIAHISSTTGFQQASFLTKWTDIEQVLLRLNTVVRNPVQDLQQTLDSYKHSPLEPVAEQRIQAEIERWKKSDKAFEKEMQLIKTDVKEVTGRVGLLTKNVNDMNIDLKEVGNKAKEANENVEKVTQDVKNVKDVITELKKEGGEVKKGLKIVTEGFHSLKGNISEVKQYAEHVQANVEEMNDDVVKVKDSVQKVKEDARKEKKASEKEIPLIKTDVKKVTERVEELMKNVNDMNIDVKEVGNKAKEANENVEKVTQDIKSVKEVITELKEEGGEVKKGVKIVTEGFHSLKGNISEVKQYAEQVQSNVKEMNDDVVKVKDSVQKVEEDVRKVEEILSNQKETKESDKIKDLQDDLISFYRDEHRTISLSPLIEENAPLLQFYVMPDIYSLKLQRTHSGVKQEKTAVTPFRNVFYKDNKMCRKIYLAADAGLGKTALSKRLTLAWCHANKPLLDEAQHFSEEEIQAVNEFRFIFLLLLRDSSSDCDIDDFIMNQIISRLGHDHHTREELVNILCEERCLVIIDGLDEWSHPLNSCKQGPSPIPHQRVRERTAFLTTTRPWKLSVSGLKSSQIDQKLELVGLNPKSANALKESVISHFFNEKNEYELRHKVEEFTRVLKEKHIADLEAIPLLLMYLLFLWCNKIELGQTQCDLYSQITELLLSRTMQNYIKLAPKVDLPKGDIPQCFSGNTNCMQFYTLLTSLGQLAYETLFNEKREENTLVFDGSVAEQYLKESLEFCLKTGLITQSKVSVPAKPLEQKFKVSFAHKTVQEFFAALYMHSTSDQTSVPEIVLSKCKCIKDILEMSKILKFICGMHVNVSSSISREMMKIINEDEITLKHRSTLDEDVYINPLKDFQDMCISCCREIPRENDVSLCLQDVFITFICGQVQYREILKQLTTKNKQNIRSLYIDMYKTPYSSVHKFFVNFALSDLENMEKIHYKCNNDRDILPLSCLLTKSVKCLHLSCRKLGEQPDSWSRLLGEKVTSLQKLEAINISGFKMSHSELTLLYDYISHRHCMRQIKLVDLSCVEHETRSCSVCLELSHHSQLNTLDLRGIPVSELNINMASLEKCRLWLSNPDLVLRFINCVPANSKLNTFQCWGLESPAAIETWLETLCLLVNVEHVELGYMNLDSREILLSPEIVNLKYVRLWYVTMTASVLQGIVEILLQQQQTVTVHIWDCDIKPYSEFVKLKQKIKTSRRHFSGVVGDDAMFMFETIKWGD